MSARPKSPDAGDVHLSRSVLDRLGALVREWRISKETLKMLPDWAVQTKFSAEAKAECADKLEAALAAQPAPAVMGNERDTLIDHYYQDQGVTPEGELRPLVSKLLKRVERAEAALARTAAAESREGRIKIIWHGTTDSHGTNDSKECSTGRVYTDPLMQQAYDEGFAHGARQPGESQ